MSQEISVETIPTRLVAGIEFSTTMSTLPHDMGVAIEKLFHEVSDSQLSPNGPVIAVYLDEMNEGRPWNCEVCLPVTEAFAEHPKLRSHELPGGRVATLTHRGSYSGLKAAYNTVFAWFTDHGHTYAGPPREIYLNSPAEVSEGELLTRLEFPVVLASS